MTRESVRGILMFVIFSPFVFAWAYIRPEHPSAPQLIVIGIVGAILTLAAYWIAGWIVRRAKPNRDTAD